MATRHNKRKQRFGSLPPTKLLLFDSKGDLLLGFPAHVTALPQMRDIVTTVAQTLVRHGGDPAWTCKLFEEDGATEWAGTVGVVVLRLYKGADEIPFPDDIHCQHNLTEWSTETPALGRPQGKMKFAMRKAVMIRDGKCIVTGEHWPRVTWDLTHAWPWMLIPDIATRFPEIQQRADLAEYRSATSDDDQAFDKSVGFLLTSSLRQAYESFMWTIERTSKTVVLLPGSEVVAELKAVEGTCLEIAEVAEDALGGALIDLHLTHSMMLHRGRG